MYIKNITKKDIRLSSFEGYKFVIPAASTCWIWEKAGAHLLNNVYKPTTPPSTDKYGNPNGNGNQPLQAGTEADWKKGGSRVAHVERFLVNQSQIPRKKLITIAKQRGVSDSLITEWLADDTSDPATIADAINELPLPDEIRFPAVSSESETDVEETETDPVQPARKGKKTKASEKVDE